MRAKHRVSGTRLRQHVRSQSSHFEIVVLGLCRYIVGKAEDGNPITCGVPATQIFQQLPYCKAHAELAADYEERCK
jgi:hypothetical protein